MNAVNLLSLLIAAAILTAVACLCRYGFGWPWWLSGALALVALLFAAVAVLAWIICTLAALDTD
jgi:hypothetical protein